MTRIAIFLSVFASTLAVMIIMPILAPLIRAMGLSESQGGWMISIGSMIMAATGAWWGAKSDHWGRKAVILAGFAGLCVSYAVYAVVIDLGLKGVLVGVPLLAALFAGRAFVGAFLPAAPAAAQAYMADTTTAETRSAGMALIGAASGLGMIAGPAQGGALALRGLIWPMVLASVLPVLAFVMVALVVPRTPPKERSTTHRLSPFAPAVRGWLLIGLLLMLTIVTLQISAGFYVQDRLNLSGSETARFLALSLSLVGLLLVATQTVQMKLLKWAPRRLVRAGAPFLMISLLVLLFTASRATYAGAYALFGVGAGLVIPGYMSGVSLAVDQDRQGAAAGLVTLMQGVAAIIAPLGSTLLYERAPGLPFAVAAVLCAGVILVGLLVAPAGRVGET
ncbi:MFS transporter [Brevundimonas sp.]|uniref:MFS transporter n=1 Tax=Brevundimonas sp. TaxID=1871086 RepID=UPI0025BF863C|nr:MFS transporter [Brevundimonas sp.]